jgi:hypothetical protein
MIVGGGMRFKTTAYRNRAIFAQFKAGRNAASLGKQYRLTIDRIRAILTAEGNKLKFSPDPFYQSLRNAQRSNLGTAAVQSVLESSP